MPIAAIITAGARRISSLVLFATLAGCVSTMDVPTSSFISQSEFLSTNASVAAFSDPADTSCLTKFETNGEGGDLAWCESYALNDLVDRFELSRDAETAALIASHVARLKAGYNRTQKDTVRNRIVGGWISRSYSEGRPHVWAVHTGMIAYPMARFAAIVRRNKIAAYQAQANDMLAFAKEAYGQMEPDWKDGAYRYPGGGFTRARGNPIPHNMQAAMGMLALAIYQADKTDQKYLRRAKRIAQRIDKATIYRSVGGKRRLAWPYDEVSGAEDTSHAILTFGFVTKMYEAGLIFSSKRYKAMLSSFLDGSIGTGSLVNGNLVSEGNGGSFKSTCNRALLIYRYHAPTFARCKV